jgi:amidase
MNLDDYLALDAVGIAEAVSAGHATAAEMHACATAQHHATDADIHAVVQWYDDPSPGLADAGPLAGVPFVRKDYGSTEAGRLQEMGSRLTQGYRPFTTSPYYQRLAAAGAQIVGRSAVPEFVMHGTTESVAFGITRNPHNLDYSVGGSSGGAAAVVAARVVPAAHATDCAGSIRIPASACGLYGLKPTSRIVPLDQGDWGGIAVEFVVSRTARDQLRFFDVLADGPVRPVRERARIALTLKHWAGGSFGPGVVAGLERAAAVLEAAGHDVEIIPVPVDLERVMRAWDAHFGRWVAHDAERFARELGRPIDETTLEPITLMQLEQVRNTTVDELTASQLVADQELARMGERLAGFDAVLMTANDRAAIPLEYLDGTIESMEVYLERNDEYFSSMFPANISGRPSIAFPIGRVDGMPAGAQLMGNRGDDVMLMRLAEQIEAAGIATQPLT